jgi:phospholipid/cholesterol/gamma-HCH transport system substrate-binding protein
VGVGFVIIAAVAVAVLGTLYLQGTNWGRPAIPVEVLISSIAQVTPGTPVKVRGVRIGEVAGIAVEPNGQAVRVFLELQQEIALPEDAAVVMAPESFFGGWQAEIVSRREYPRFDFFDVPPEEGGRDVRVLAGYTLPELSRLSASADEISQNLATLSERFEIAFNEQTAQNLARSIENFGLVSDDLRSLVLQQSRIVLSLTTSADSALSEIEEASRAARRSFERVEAIMTDSQLDSIVANVQAATASLQAIAAEFSSSSGDIASVLVRADSAFLSVERVMSRIESGQGTVGRLFSDSTLGVRAENLLTTLDLLLLDLRENPRRYVRLSIF